MRSVIRDELGDLLAEGGVMRCTMRSEVEAALQNWGGQSPGTSPRVGRQRLAAAAGGQAGRQAEIVEPTCPELGKETNEDLEDADEAAELKRPSTCSLEAAGTDHFSQFVKDATKSAHVIDDVSDNGDDDPIRRVVSKARSLRHRLKGVEEPHRTGRVEKFITGNVFELIITLIIILNTLWMLYAADVQIQRPNYDDALVYAVDWVFQTLFTIEVLLRLFVHREWFFRNKAWRMNVFELALVIVGFISLGRGSGSSGSALRILRFLGAAGRAARVLRITTHLRPLRALIVCLQGSLMSLLWSLIMILMVYSIFSLFLVQIITSHIDELGETVETTIFYDSFGSIMKSILTLHIASTGGDDWINAYQLIQTTGVVGSAVYLAFIIFMQFALLNIITGIFVDSAMAVLRPDGETLAMELCKQDRMQAERLRGLCQAVDADESGKLKREEFEDGLHKKHIPLMLKSLGLHRHHLVEFFGYLAEVQDNDGQVDIDTFVQGRMLLKGAVSNFEIHKLHAEIKANHVQLKQLLRDRLEG